MAWIKKQIQSQWIDNSSVRPEHRWSDTERAFYMNSAAGVIKYKPRKDQELIAFRAKYINRFEDISRSTFLSDDEKTREFFKLYAEIKRKESRASYRANARTRLRGKFWSLRALL